MDIRKVIRRRIRHRGSGVDLVGDVNAVVAANVGRRRSATRVSSTQRVVSRGGTNEAKEPDRS